MTNFIAALHYIRKKCKCFLDNLHKIIYQTHLIMETIKIGLIKCYLITFCLFYFSVFLVYFIYCFFFFFLHFRALHNYVFSFPDLQSNTLNRIIFLIIKSGKPEMQKLYIWQLIYKIKFTKTNPKILGTVSWEIWPNLVISYLHIQRLICLNSQTRSLKVFVKSSLDEGESDDSNLPSLSSKYWAISSLCNWIGSISVCQTPKYQHCVPLCT